jgi:hypothetical protein
MISTTDTATMTFLVEGRPDIIANLIKDNKECGVWVTPVVVWGVEYSIIKCDSDPEDDGNVKVALCIGKIRKLFPGRKVVDFCDLPRSAFEVRGHPHGRQYNGGSGSEEATTLSCAGAGTVHPQQE